MPRHIKLELMKVLPPETQLYIMYGATEAAARLTYVPPDKLKSKIDSIGIPIPGTKIQVISPDGFFMKPGEVGEIVAQGDNIMLGYYKDETATNKVLDQHGYHTGDLGYSDADGYLFLTGRKDDLIKVRGHRFNPREVEDIIIESGRVIECIVLAIPDVYLDYKLAALVVPIKQSDTVLREIMEYCHAKLPKHKVPDSFAEVAAIPKKSNGKPDRPRSRELLNKMCDEGAC